MPIYSNSKPVETPTVPVSIHNPYIHVPDYRHSLIDYSINGTNALLTVVEGSNYRTDYYSQFLAADEALAEFDPAQQGAYQQYHKLKDFIIKLQGSMSTSIDPNTNTASLTGTALIYPSIKPNVGDAFLGDIGDGRIGQFTVTEVNTPSIHKNTVYEIQFSLSRQADEHIVALLEDKVVKRSVYQEDFLLYGKNPVITSVKYAELQELKTSLSQFFDYWLRKFYSKEFSTILVPTKTSTYDVSVINAITKTTNEIDFPLLREIHYFNCDNNSLFSQHTVWDLIIDGKEYGFGLVARQHGVYTNLKYSNHVLLNSVMYSGIKQVITMDTDPGNAKDRGKTIPWEPSQDILDTKHEVGDGLSNLYMFSQAFYDEDKPNMNPFEKMVYTYIVDDILIAEEVLYYIKTLPKASPLEFFYYGLVVYILGVLVSRGN